MTGRAAQAQTLETLAGEIKDQTLGGGTLKVQEEAQGHREAGTTVPTTRAAVVATPGITQTPPRMTGTCRFTLTGARNTTPTVIRYSVLNL